MMTPIRSSNDENNCLSFAVWSDKKSIICPMPVRPWPCQVVAQKITNAIQSPAEGAFSIVLPKNIRNRFEAIWLQHCEVRLVWLHAVWGPMRERERESLLRTTDQTTDFSAIFGYKFVDNEDDDNNDQPTKHPIRTSHHFTSLRSVAKHSFGSKRTFQLHRNTLAAIRRSIRSAKHTHTRTDT